MSSFGDWIALSDTVDTATANLISREVSDGIIAPAYQPDALKILCRKKGGIYVIIKIDQDYVPDPIETRQVFGITLEQHNNSQPFDPEVFKNIVTKSKSLPDSALLDMTIAWITLKYTQSNSVCYVLNGQTIGVGAGQQSRIHCTRLAGTKADLWWLRQHPATLSLKFKSGLIRPQKDNAIDQFLGEDVTPSERARWQDLFVEIPAPIPEEEKSEWTGKLKGVVLGSDAFFPFRDSIDRAAMTGVNYVLQPGGSNRDDVVIDACNQYKMAMVFSSVRLFHH
jgi:phosphoribosylaminoimidazolecarboxamide formyltransferase/IMP cyclohydrolase